MTENLQIELERILFAIERVELFIKDNRKLESYIHDELMQSAIGLQFIVIGEATKALSLLKEPITLHYSKEIIGLRNRIAHAYDSVDHIAIWNIVINHLPKLKLEVENLLNPKNEI
jgi:uncharacterized protein with HEPN domain